MSERATQKFALGKLNTRPEAREAIHAAGMLPAQLLLRHVAGDWGDLEYESDRKLNEEALRDGHEICSVYRLPTGVDIWIETLADRSATEVGRY